MKYHRWLAVWIAVAGWASAALWLSACSTTATQDGKRPDATDTAVSDIADVASDVTTPGTDAVIPDGGSVTTRTDATGPYAEQCKAGAAVCDDGNPCTVDGCDPVKGCTATIKPCADTDPCTMDSCDVATGDCTHAPDPCEDGNACTVGTCTPEDGCTFAPVDCADGDLCTSDGCTPAGGCQHAALSCDDGKSCTADSCDPAKGCVNQGPASGTCCEIASDCEDGSACTTHACNAGLCVTTPVFGCCQKDADCDDGNSCTTETCTQSTGVCAVSVKAGAGCCQKDLDCDDGNSCTVDRCQANSCGHEPICCKSASDCAPVVGAATNCATASCAPAGCVATPKTDAQGNPPNGCCAAVGPSTDFEAGSAWQVQLVPSQFANWKVTAGVGKNGTTGLQFIASPTPIPGGAAVAQARMDAQTLPLGVDSKLTFVYKGSLGVGDQMRLRVTTAVGSWLVWQGGGAGSFVSATVDLSGFGARATTSKIKLIFEVTGAKGSPAGWVVDDIALTSTCKARACTVDAQCADGLGATADFCAAGQCAWGPPKEYCEPGSACDDGNVCTTDICSNFGCQHLPVANCCVVQSDCEDKNPCTQDFCNGANQCQHIKQPGTICCNTAADCDDKLLCTQDLCPVAGLPCAHTVTDANCCDSVADCNDKNDCTIDTCGQNQCSHKDICCNTDADCDDGDALCTTDACINGKCQWTKLVKPGCCEPTLLTADFESGVPAGFILSGSSATVKWQVVTGLQSKSGKGALYYGNPQTKNFDDGNPSTGTAVLMNKLEVPQNDPTTLTFWLYMDTEGGTYDDLGVEVLDQTAKKTVAWLKSQQNFQTMQWAQVTVDLSKWAGQTVTLQLYFDTKDQIGNQGQGVFVDDISITRTCAN